MIVEEVNGDKGRVLGEGHEKDVLEGLGSGLRLLGGKPFLEEGGEGVAIDDLAAAGVAKRYLSVAFEGQAVEVVLPAIPSGCLGELVNIEGLAIAVAGKDIVEPQGVSVELLVEALGGGAQCECRHNE